MAQWKKIIVSGSDAELRTLTSSVSIGVGTNQIISTDPSLTKLSGSFSGSYYGDGSNLTGVIATDLNIDLFGSDLTAITVASTDLLILSDNGTEGRITVSQLANPLTGTGLTEVSGKITLDTGSTHFTSGVKQKLDTEAVVSSSAQVVSLLPTGTVSGSSQVELVKTDSGSFTTDMVGEGANLYYTDERVKTKLDAETVVSSSAQIQLTKVDSGSFTTDMVGEGANLYYTDERVKTKLDTENVVSSSTQIDVTQTQNYSTLATTGSNIFFGTQVITGSMFITNDLVVQGSSSLQFITASAVELGTNTIILNTDTPAVRFAGISVVDSGSGQGATGSLWWDSLTNHWIYEHPTDSEFDHNSAFFIAGPKNYGSLGDETGLTSGSIPVAVDGFHIEDSAITQIVNDGSASVTVTGDLNITGKLSATEIEGIGGNIVSASLDSSTVDFTITSGVITANLIGGVVSGSSQVIGILDSLNTYTGSNDTLNTAQNNRLTSLETASGSAIGRLDNLETFSGSVNTKFSTLQTYTASVDVAISALNTYTGSNDTLNTEQNNRLTSLETASGSAIGRLNNIESFTSSINTTIKTQLDANTVISGSSQVQLDSITGTTFANTPYSFPNNLVVDGDLTVNGTTVTINTTNLLVEDKFILLNSGSTNPDEGGLVIDEGNGEGHAFVYDSDSSRWGFTASLSSTATSVTPDAFAAAVVTSDIEEYRQVGNIRVDGNGDIFIYV